MTPSVCKDFAQRFTKAELDEAITAFETDLTNALNVPGKDEGEMLSHLLVAAFLRERMDQGTPINEALREYSQRVRSMIGGKKSG
jgi:hypothetical protein